MMCPQESLSRAKWTMGPHCGATCLHPPREHWDRNPCRLWTPVLGTVSCMCPAQNPAWSLSFRSVKHPRYSTKMQPWDTSQEQGLEEGETGSPVSRRADGRAFYSACFPGPSLLPKERTNETGTCRKHFPMRVTCRWLGADNSHMTRHMDVLRSTGAGC